MAERRFFKLSYGRKIMLLSVGMIVLTLCLNLVFFAKMLELCSATLFERTANALTYPAASVQNQIETLENLSYNMIASAQIQQTLYCYRQEQSDLERKRQSDVLQQYCNNYLVNVQNVREVTLVLPDNLLSTGNYPSNMLAEQREKMILAARRANGGGVYDFSQDCQTLYFARQIRQSDPLTLDELAIVIFEADISRAVDPGFGGTQFFVMSRADAKARYGVDDASQGYRVCKLENARWFVTYLNTKDGAWSYLIQMPYQELVSELYRVEALLWFCSLATLAVVVTITSRLTSRLTQPVEMLAKKIKNADIETVEWTDEMKRYEKRHDEVGALYQAFDSIRNNTKRLIEENYRAELLVNQSRLYALQMQINPHFLYNTLESIRFLAVMHGRKEIASMVEALGELLRYSIDEKKEMATLQEELEIAKKYLNILKVRLGDRLDWQIDVPKTLLKLELPKMTLQPLLENAVQYGIERCEDGGMVRIRAMRQGTDALIQVIDSGELAPLEKMQAISCGEFETKTKSIGLRNIHQRLALVFGPGYGLEFSRTAQGTVVGVRVALHLKE